MQATRRARLESVIQDELSQLIRREIKDPRVVPVTVTKVEVTEDAEQATIYVAQFGVLEPNEETRKTLDECIDGLQSASGFMRRHLARCLNIRHIPSLIFRADHGLENTLRVHELLKKIDDEKDKEKADTEKS